MREQDNDRSSAQEQDIGVHASVQHLTQREIDVLRLICRGMTNREIADALATTVAIVKWRTTQMFDKLDVQNRVQAVARVGKLVASDPAMKHVAPPRLTPESPKRLERQILHLLAYGLTNAQIAGSLGITTGTVKWYMGELYGKLHVRNRIEMLFRAHQRRWL
jgi:DNA-binding NarL/FixJ family response regulator